MNRKQTLILHMFLILLPWLVLHGVDTLFPRLLIYLFGSGTRAGPFVALAPFHLLLGIGTIIAWRRAFPVWSYAWIGTWYFFVYRELFQVVVQLAPRLFDKPDVAIHGFYFGVNPILLAVLLVVASRRNWLLACFVAYPYTSIIQAWWTLDTTPIPILVVTLLLYMTFAFLFIALKHRAVRFGSLLAGTVLIGIGFFVFCSWPGWPNFLFLATRLLLIILFPLMIAYIPFCRKVLKVRIVEPAHSADLCR